MVQGNALRIGGKRISRPKFSRVVMLILLLSYLFLLLLPIFYVVLNAFKPLDEMFVYPPRWIPRNFTFTNFSQMSALLSQTVIPLSPAESTSPTSTSTMRPALGTGRTPLSCFAVKPAAVSR